MNKKACIVIGILVSLIFIGIGFTVGYTIKSNFPTIVTETVIEKEYYNFELCESDPEYEWKYKLLPDYMSDYITNLCNEIELDSDLVVAILLKENPELNPLAEHRNDNGTIDCGLFQLNSKYIYTDFVPKYWQIPEDFNPFNWKMNTYLAVHHIKNLMDIFEIKDDAVAAYNCGAGRVIKNDIPEITRSYTKSVLNNYKLLKIEVNDEK